jgi:hypothetical protein
MKNVVKCYKHFFGYFNALETHSEEHLYNSLQEPRTRYQELSQGLWSFRYFEIWRGKTQKINEEKSIQYWYFSVDPNVKAGTYLKRKHTIYVRIYVCTLWRLVVVPFIFTQTFFEKQGIHFKIRQIFCLKTNILTSYFLFLIIMKRYQ